MTKFTVGDQVRLKAANPYPPLAKLIAAKAQSPYTLESVWSIGEADFVKIRWSDGTLSGALYAEMFEEC